MEIIDIKDSIVSEQIKASIDEMVNAYCDELIKQDKEITRLNNIINELDKEMKDIIKEYEIYTKYDINDIRDLTGSYWYGYSDCADEVLCRIKELKEK